MSICSDVTITKEEAIKRVLDLLLYEQTILINLAVSKMGNWELTSYLNKDNDTRYYTIKED